MRSLVYICILTTTLAFSQQEASVWYFGQNAGLKFETNGTVTPLGDGVLNTNEGCSSIADTSGNLLFYTDGRTVWDRNHVAMPNGSFANGTELFGDGSSTQSGIIVPKPGSSTLYYIFTVDEPHHKNALAYPNAFTGSYGDPDSGSTPANDDGRNNGLNYSLVDLSVVGSNGSQGDVVSRNNHLVTYDTNPLGEEIKYKCSEKITAIRNEVDGSYWVITHFVNRFYAFKVTATGVVTAPVVSAVGSNQTLLGYRRNAIGYLKASPDGTKLAIAHQQNGTNLGTATYSSGSVELFDFNGTTGAVSNAITVIPNVQAYGVEFSPNSEKLYATYRIGTTVNMELVQLDLTSSTIPNSKVVIYNQFYNLNALQLAINNKIYCATSSLATLGVINNPDASGTACNYVHNGQPLAGGKIVNMGLPPFITSFFNASFTAENLCLGGTTQFTLSASQNVSSVVWDFGDGSPTSTTLNPSHQYASPGTYQVTATITGLTGVITRAKSISIATVPLAAGTVTNQVICGTVGQVYDLSAFNSTLLGSQSPAAFGIAYFTSMADLVNHTNVLPTSYSLQLGTTSFFAKLYNLANSACYAVSNFSLTLYRQPIANTPTDNWLCDDTTNDGIGLFDLGSNTAVILGSQSASQYNVSYHLSQNDADTNSNGLSPLYQNLSNPQTIYVRVENNQNIACYTTTSFQLGLYAMPIIASQPADLYACDSGNDNVEAFDLSPQTASILGTQSATNFTVTYHATLADAHASSNSLPINFTNTTNPQTLYARISNNASTACYAVTSFQLIVKAEPILNLDDSFTICEGHPISISAPSGFSSYQWSNGGMAANTTIGIAGNYSLTVTKNYGVITCSTVKNFAVDNSNIAAITHIATQDWTSHENVIDVEVTGDGDYEYSIDGIHYQDLPSFSGLASGQYTVYVNDKKGCGYTTQEVFLLTYPKFFTPNGDGINDVWRIKFSNAEPDMELLIFDRYGKIITGFKGTDFGWDGTLIGKPLFADDYWFVVKRQDGREFRGHFSLLR